MWKKRLQPTAISVSYYAILQEAWQILIDRARFAIHSAQEAAEVCTSHQMQTYSSRARGHLEAVAQWVSERPEDYERAVFYRNWMLPFPAQEFDGNANLIRVLNPKAPVWDRDRYLSNIPRQAMLYSYEGHQWGSLTDETKNLALDLLAWFLPPQPGISVETYDGVVSKLAMDLHLQFAEEVVTRLPQSNTTIEFETTNSWLIRQGVDMKNHARYSLSLR